MYLAVAGGDGILERGLNVSQSVAASWSDHWDTIFDSELFSIVSFSASVMAVVVVGVYAIEAFNEANEGNFFLARTAQKLLWPMIAVMFFANNGALMATAARSARAFTHEMNKQVLEVTLLGVDLTLEDAMLSTIARGVAANEVSAQIAQCQGMIGQRQFDCLKAANEQVQDTIKAYETRWLLPVSSDMGGIAESLNNILVRLGDATIGGTIDGAIDGITVDADEGPLEVGVDALAGAQIGQLSGFFKGLAGTAVNAIVMSLLVAMQWAFVNILEISMILTALTMPLAVALTILPYSNKALIAWLIAFLSLGLCQFYYNVVMGVIAVTVTNSSAIDINGYLIILALFGPALALAMAAGGGIAIFNIIAGGTITAAVAVGTRVATGGLSGG